MRPIYALCMILLFALVACKPAPPDAPEELDQLVGFLFEHVDDDEADYLQVGAVNTDAWLDKRLQETLEGYSVDDLSLEAINALGGAQQDAATVEALAGAAVGHESAYDVETLMEAIINDDPLDVYPGVYLANRRDAESREIRCFMEQECDRIEFEVWAEFDYGVVQVSTNSMVQYRWVDTDLGKVVVERTWLRSPADVQSIFDLRVQQQYFMWAAIPAGDDAPAGVKTRSIQATWVVAEFGEDEVDDDIALNLVINSMVKNSNLLEDWIAAN